MSWKRISCGEYEEHLSIMGDHKRVYSGFTDISGQFGAPRIETVWGRDDDEDLEPIVKGVRFPAMPGGDPAAPQPDRAPCEHYFYESDGW